MKADQFSGGAEGQGWSRAEGRSVVQGLVRSRHRSIADKMDCQREKRAGQSSRETRARGQAGNCCKVSHAERERTI